MGCPPVVMFGGNQGIDPNAGGAQSYADIAGGYQPPPGATGAAAVGSTSTWAQIQAALNNPLGPNFLAKTPLGGVPLWVVILVVLLVPGGLLWALIRWKQHRSRTPHKRPAK